MFTVLTATATVPWLNSLWWLILAALGLPAAVTGFLVRRVEKSMDDREERQAAERLAQEQKAEERERNREKMDILILQMSSAAIALGEATARAVQRIPDAHCNGDMHAALDYAAKVKHAQKDFLTELGIHALHDD